jgi:hypothetical protein
LSNLIYHYTTINTLALIFSNKTLRLNSLANVDDMEEGQADIFGDMSKYVFVSSWTRDKAENIALWNMYTPNMKGVRIGIDPSKILLEHGTDNEIINIHSNRQTIAYENGEFLSPVEYNKKPIVELFDSTGKLTRTQILNLGRRKNQIWAFQREVRFILMGLPLSKVERYDFLSRENNFFEKVLHKEESNINYIDLILPENVWENSEILLGPNTDLGDKRILSALIKTYHPSAGITTKKSEIKIRTKKY